MPVKCKKKAAAIAAAIVLISAIKVKKKQQRIWSRKWLLRRGLLGCYDNLMRELALEDAEGYRRFLRMTTEQFDVLLEKCSSRLQKQSTTMRECLSPGARLAITLRYLATGCTQTTLAFQFRVAQNTISGIIPATCEIIFEMLQEYICVPETSEEWENISCEFYQKWQFPNCIGALDGKHIKIKPPPNSGSLYYNYKGDFSIVLMALADADLNFIYVDVGTNGRVSDGGVWDKCSLKLRMAEGSLSIPRSKVLPGTNHTLPYVIIADDAFPLQLNIMKPYSGKKLTHHQIIFNYRLSRARRVVENAFGILAARFQVFRCSLLTSPVRAQKIVKAACALHNFLNKTSEIPSSCIDVEDLPNRCIHPGDWRNQSNAFLPLTRSNARGNYQAKEVQKTFLNYFNDVGAVSWQNDMALLH